MIFKDFWLLNPNENNWKEKFSELFGFSVDTFSIQNITHHRLKMFYQAIH